MKTFTRSLLAGTLGATMLMTVAQANASTEPYRHFHIGGEEKPAKAAHARTTMSSRNNNAVKIYPDILKRTMHVVAKENEGKEIDFFVFDLQGTLIQNVRMKERDHYRITGLARGKYIYRVFSGDEESAHGQFEIR